MTTSSPECWAVKKSHQQKLHVAEMKMLRMMFGATMWGKVRNEYIGSSDLSLRVHRSALKLPQSRLRWYGHVSRKGENDVVKKVWRRDSEIKLSRGRLEQTWDIHEHIKTLGQTIYMIVFSL